MTEDFPQIVIPIFPTNILRGGPMSNLLSYFAICSQRILLAVLFMFVSSSNIFAQETGKIAGKVKDAETGDALFQASVVVAAVGREMAPRGAATNISGGFEIKDLPAGTYKVTVSYVGYTTTMQEIQLSAGEAKRLDIALQPTGVNVNPTVVTASRRPEKALEAPAAMSVIDAAQIKVRPALLSPAEYLQGLPAVDINSNGICQKNVVVRGFNNIFSGSLQSLTDNRIAQVPSLRLNAYNFYPITNEDIERVEVVSGPGSAMYGPNSANGVFHILTKSPFGSEGTTVSVGGGERSVFMSSLRHAGSVSERFGYKISGQYYRGHDWESFDPADVAPRKAALGRETTTGRTLTGDSVNIPNFDVKKLAGEVRLDYRFSDDATLILNGGVNRGSHIELTGIGAAQAKDWTYSYAQARLTYKDLFVQGFINASDAGDSYLLRTGDLVSDNSKMIVGQIQHGLSVGERQKFTYGVDVLLTRPDTKGTINGRNEDKSHINEVGGYLQSETSLSSQLNFVAAARIDKHNVIKDAVFSPRAALVYKPNPDHNFRATYNRAFSTPTTNNLFLDILAVPDVFGLGGLFKPLLGFSPSTDIRAQGVPETGFNFSRSSNGLPQFRSPFAPLAGLPTSTFIDLNNPLFTNVMWSVGRGAVLSAFIPTFRAILTAQGFSQSQINSLIQDFSNNIVPQQVSNVNNVMRTLNPTTGQFSLVDNVVDVGRMKPTITQTFEAGYKGLIGGKLLVGIDVYYTKVKDFVGPLIVETPNAFLDPTTLSAFLGQQFFARLAARPSNDTLKNVLQALDNPAFGGNGNGSPVDELTRLFVAGTKNNGAAFIPFGTVIPKEAFDPTALILTYRNFGDVSLTGADFSLAYYATKNWTFTGNFSYVDKDFFGKSSTQPQDIALNASKRKSAIGVEYRNDDVGVNAGVRLRYVMGFPVNTGVYIGTVSDYTLVDVNIAYDLSFIANTRLTVNAQNILDRKHREMVGAPEIGRLVLTRLTYSF